MRYYETLYIVNPNYEQERLSDVTDAVAEEVKKSGVKIIDQFVWGKKRLAYKIQNHKYGTYILLHLEADNPGFLNDFNMFMKLNKAVIRAQTIRLDEKPEPVKDIKADAMEKDKVVEAKEDAGLDTKTERAVEGTVPVKDAEIEDSSESKDEEQVIEQEKPAEVTTEEPRVTEPEVETETKTVDESPDKQKTEKVETGKDDPEPGQDSESESASALKEDKPADHDDNDTSEGKEEQEEK
jgi:small subunit ribosomal protein S6